MQPMLFLVTAQPDCPLAEAYAGRGVCKATVC
jgi:hypothetical protein